MVGFISKALSNLLPFVSMSVAAAPESLARLEVAGIPQISTQDVASDLPTLVARVRPSVVSVEARDKSGQTVARGSGFLLQNQEVVTALHVVAKAASVQVRFEDGVIVETAGVIGSDDTLDVALLQIPVGSDAPPGLVLASAAPSVGTRVFTIGTPLGLEYSTADGIVSGYRDESGIVGAMQLTVPLSPGSSGSPIIDMNGLVVGVATSRLTAEQSITFATPSMSIQRIARHPVVDFVSTQLAHASDESWGFSVYGLNDAQPFDEYKRRAAQFRIDLPGDAVGTRDAKWYFDAGYWLSQDLDWDAAAHAFGQATRLEPRLAIAHLFLSEAILWKERAALIDRMFREHRELGIVPDPNRIHDLKNSEECVVQALDALRLANLLNPNEPEIHDAIERCLKDLPSEVSRESVLTKCIERWPHWPEAHIQLGKAIASRDPFNLSERGQRHRNDEEERTEYTKALEIDPTYARAHNALAWTTSPLDDGARMHHLAKAVQFDQGDARYCRSLADGFWSFAESADEMQDPARADEMRRTAMNVLREGLLVGAEPAHLLWSKLGHLFMETGQWEAARDALVEAIRLSTTRATVDYDVLHLGQVHIQLRDFEAARAQYKLLMEINPQDAARLRALLREWGQAPDER